MSDHYYLDVELKLENDSAVVLTPAYFQASIESSMRSIFGEIGGQTELELLKFDIAEKRGVLKVPEGFYKHLRASLTLIGHFQDIPCHYKVHATSREPLVT